MYIIDIKKSVVYLDNSDDETNNIQQINSANWKTLAGRSCVGDNIHNNLDLRLQVDVVVRRSRWVAAYIQIISNVM